jgi:transcription antitermination factor NusA-like protein
MKGKKGAFIFLNKISKITSKKTEMIKYSEDVKIFISNYFSLKGDEEVKVLNKTSGGYVSAIMFIKPHRRGLIIGKQGKRIQDARNLLQKYFGFNKLYIK